jgi:hypothetical protein
MATPFWIKFSTGSPACVEAKDETEAKTLAAELGKREVVSATILPYPAEPRLNKHEHTFTDGSKDVCLSFCYTPEQCKGRTACPKNYSCTE